jgi:hypothetical protein
VNGHAMVIQASLSWGCAQTTCELLAALPGANERWLEIADAIAAEAGHGHGSSGMAWLRATLARYPGSAVAAANNADGCTVLARGWTVERFRLCGHHPCAPLVGASLVHSWLAAGWPATALRHLELAPTGTVGQPRLGRWRVRGQAGGSPLLLVISVWPACPSLSSSI